MEETLTRITYSEPISIEIEKGQRGGYGWKIKVKGSNSDAVRLEIGVIDSKLREQFPAPAAEVK